MSKSRFNPGQHHLIPAASRFGITAARKLPHRAHAGVHCPPVQTPLQLKRSDLQSSCGTGSLLSQQAGLKGPEKLLNPNFQRLGPTLCYTEWWGRGMNRTSAVACDSKFQEGRNMLGSFFSLGCHVAWTGLKITTQPRVTPCLHPLSARNTR